MMKRPYTAILVLMTLVAISCDDNDSDSGKNKRSQPSEIHADTSEPVARDTVFYSEFFDRIRSITDSLYVAPENTSLAAHLLRESYDTSTGCFFVAGKGAPNPALPPAARAAGRRLAAKYTAERWALYLKAWNTGKKVPFGRPVEGKIMYSTIVYERIEGDTLHTLVQIPIGSVVVHSVHE